MALGPVDSAGSFHSATIDRASIMQDFRFLLALPSRHFENCCGVLFLLHMYNILFYAWLIKVSTGISLLCG